MYSHRYLHDNLYTRLRVTTTRARGPRATYPAACLSSLVYRSPRAARARAARAVHRAHAIHHSCARDGELVSCRAEECRARVRRSAASRIASRCCSVALLPSLLLLLLLMPLPLLLPPPLLLSCRCSCCRRSTAAAASANISCAPDATESVEHAGTAIDSSAAAVCLSGAQHEIQICLAASAGVTSCIACLSKGDLQWLWARRHIIAHVTHTTPAGQPTAAAEAIIKAPTGALHKPRARGANRSETEPVWTLLALHYLQKRKASYAKSQKLLAQI